MSDTIASDIPTRVAVLEEIARGTLAILDRVDATIDRFNAKVEVRFDQMERRFEQIGRRLERVDDKFERTNSRMDSQFRWMPGIMLGGFGALLGVVAHGFHWI